MEKGHDTSKLAVLADILHELVQRTEILFNDIPRSSAYVEIEEGMEKGYLLYLGRKIRYRACGETSTSLIGNLPVRLRVHLVGKIPDLHRALCEDQESKETELNKAIEKLATYLDGHG